MSKRDLAGPKSATTITWKPKGHWARDPQATISIHLQQISPNGEKARNIATLAEAIPYHASPVVLDLSPYTGRRHRLILRKDGDPETGGCSPAFNLN